MPYDLLELNPGTGGSKLATEIVDQNGTSVTFPIGLSAFGVSGGPFTLVSETAGLPVRLADGSGYLSTLPVSAASLPLPSGAATAANQSTANASLATLAGAVSGTEVQVDVLTMPTVTISDGGGAITVDGAVAVTGTFWQATQPVSIAATVTVTGAGGTFPVTDSGGSLTVDAPVGTPAFVRLSDGVSAISTLPVSLASVPSHDVTNAGTFAVQAAQSGTWNVTNVSGTVSLPTGAATAAKQPALGTAGAASADVLTVQGIASMTPLLVNGSGVTQPVSAASLPLPTGASTEATLSTLSTNIADVKDTVASAITSSHSVLDVRAVLFAVNPGGTYGNIERTNGGNLKVAVEEFDTSLPAGTNNIGDVDVLTLPALAAGDNAIGRVKLTDGTDVADVLDLTNANPLTVAIVDGSGDQITAFGGGTQYTEGDTDASITGTAFLWEDTGDTLRAVSAAKPLPIGDAGGSLTVDNGGTFAVQAAQTGTWTVDLGATDNAVLDAIAASLAGTLTVGSHAVTNAGTFAVQAAQSGTWNITNVSGTVSLPTGAATLAEQQTQTTSLQLLDDAVATTGAAITAKGIAVVGTDGTNARILKTDASGELQVDVLSMPTTTVTGTVAATQSGTWTVTGTGGTFPVTDSGGSLTVDAPVGTPVFVRLSDGASAISTLPVSLASVPSHAVTNAGTFAVQAAQSGTWNVGTVTTLTTCSTVTTVSTLTGGGIAHDSADSGNPVKIGAKAVATPSTATMVAAADRTDATSDLDGALLVRLGSTYGDLISERVTDTGGTSTAFTNFGATASTRNYVTAITVYNSSATAGYVDIRDGTAGSVLYTIPLPAGGGAVLTNGGAPLFRSSANTALAYDVSAALSTVYISMTGFKSKV